jgi:hypothetical protein
MFVYIPAININSKRTYPKNIKSKNNIINFKKGLRSNFLRYRCKTLYPSIKYGIESIINVFIKYMFKEEISRKRKNRFEKKTTAIHFGE